MESVSGTLIYQLRLINSCQFACRPMCVAGTFTLVYDSVLLHLQKVEIV